MEDERAWEKCETTTRKSVSWGNVWTSSGNLGVVVNLEIWHKWVSETAEKSVHALAFSALM